ncbi:hypothetical protein P3L10_003014 [Capsicum annuum]
MVAVGCFPFSFPSSDAFIRYIQAICNPMFNGIPRTTCRSDIFRLHSQYYIYLSTLLKNIQCRLSLTSDLGRAVNKNDYLNVTCHWMDSNFMMQKHILVFLYDEDRKHTGQFIADFIVKIVRYYGIENKILCIAFDNASNNKTAITKIKSTLSPPLPEIFHIKCACHIYNLIVKDGLDFFELYIEKIRLAVGFIQGNNRSFPIPPIYLVGAMLNPCMKYNHMCHFSTFIYTNLEINNNHDSEQVQPDLWTATADAKDYIEKLYNHYADLFDLFVPTNITPIVAPHPPEEPSSSKSADERTYTSTYREELKYYLRAIS